MFNTSISNSILKIHIFSMKKSEYIKSKKGFVDNINVIAEGIP
jgi:hypothetical protein